MNIGKNGNHCPRRSYFALNFESFCLQNMCPGRQLLQDVACGGQGPPAQQSTTGDAQGLGQPWGPDTHGQTHGPHKY